MIYNFSLLVLVICVGASIDSVQSQKCGKNPLDDMDELIANVIPFGDPKVSAPTKMEDLPGFCSYYKNSLTELDEANKKCVKTGHRTMINVVLLNIRKRAKDICSTKKTPEAQAKRKSFVTLGGCIHSGGAQIKKCIASSKDKIVAIENAPQDKKLPLLCCELRNLRGCITQTLTSQPGCNSEQSAQKMRDFVATFGASNLAQACAEHTQGDKCKSVSFPRKKKSQHVPKSFIMPVLNVLNSL